jgi:hypothetical protein
MQRPSITRITLAGAAFLLFAFALASGSPASAQGRDPRLADSKQPGSVIVFPKFVRGFVAPDGISAPRTEFEGRSCLPKGPAVLRAAESQDTVSLCLRDD